LGWGDLELLFGAVHREWLAIIKAWIHP
jgi:hypothetical protein